jgi:hypothetical protein
VLAAAAVVGRAGPARARRARRAAGLAGATAALALGGLVLVLAPRVGQGSGELFLLLAPAFAGLWAGLRAHARGAAAPSA